MGKDILMKLKKKYVYINNFQSSIIIFPQNHHVLQHTSANAAPVFEIRPLRVLSHKSACPNSPSLNRLTHHLIVPTSTH